ncbi:MAG: alanine racemase [Proteobacteria bacterium]|nr:alanine racemase [Pseudomonadota bacterium]
MSTPPYSEGEPVKEDGYRGLLTIDLDALAENYRHLKRIASPATCSAVVKANAYGLGVEQVAARLQKEGCDTFFVATLAEAVRLRNTAKDAAIGVFEGVGLDTEEIFARVNAIPVLNSLDQIKRWAAFARSHPDRFPGGAPAMVHIDTGMTRLGLSAGDVATIAQQPDMLNGVRLDYVMTHLACADEPSRGLNREQLELFASLRSHFPAARTSIGNSAGTLLGPEFRGDLVRPGIALYGANPFTGLPNPMKEVVRLQGRIIQVRDIDRPLPVGYGATHTARPPCRLATVAVGYADGYPRSLGNRGFACIGEKRIPIVGKVSMDLIIFDVSDLPAHRVQPGGLVDLIGGGVPVDEIAEVAGTIAYELLANLGGRYRRIYQTSA